MTQNEVDLVIKYLENRVLKKNSFSWIVLTKIKNSKTEGERNYWIQKNISPKILTKILKGVIE